MPRLVAVKAVASMAVAVVVSPVVNTVVAGKVAESTEGAVRGAEAARANQSR